MKHIPEETKQQAIALRQQGLTYRQISGNLGISEIWCKRNLKDCNATAKQKFNKLYTKSKTNSGVSKSEIYDELEINAFPEQEQGAKVTSAVKRIRANNKQNIVRPDWMIPTAARFCTDAIVNLSMDIEDRCHEEATRLRSTLLNSTDVSLHKAIPSTRRIKSAILGLSMAAVSNQKHGTAKLSNWLDNLYRTSNALEHRNPGTIIEVSKSRTDYLDDLEDMMY